MCLTFSCLIPPKNRWRLSRNSTLINKISFKLVWWKQQNVFLRHILVALLTNRFHAQVNKVTLVRRPTFYWTRRKLKTCRAPALEPKDRRVDWHNVKLLSLSEPNITRMTNVWGRKEKFLGSNIFKLTYSVWDGFWLERKEISWKAFHW